MGIKLAKPEHEVAYQDICALVNKHADEMTPLELLAVAANMLGKLVALQDRRSTTPDRALEVIMHNLEYGNEQAVREIQHTRGHA